MMFSQLLKFTALLAIATLVNAECTLENVITEEEKGVKETRPEVCQTQGEGDWTFTMMNSMVGVPTFNGGNAFAGVTGNDAFLIFDEDCMPHGVYSPGNNGECGIPYEVQEGFLRWTMIIESVNMFMGGGDFSFAYGAGTYTIGENHCACQDISEGLRAEQACGCSFPVNGE
ncbi:hypothetical protein FQN54_004712 [Arachnomyces sp. PD_36]|nr:hypothetical protein FQN54_004712 [Arachnomyces sp. PD_36]